MKLFTRGLIALTVSFACLSASAQQLQKPSFTEAADRIEVSIADLQQTFFLSKGDQGSFKKGSPASVEGEVIQSLSPSASMRTVIIRATDLSLVQINRISEPEKEIYYTGRISNINGEYGYVLKRVGEGYVFEKFKTADLLQLCSK